MESIWTMSSVRELDFVAASRLLAMKTKSRSLSSTEQLYDESSDEDEPEDDESDGITSRLTCNLATCDHDALLNKFLDRLGEVFAREKSASHVAAAALLRADMGDSMTVLVAKNEGLDDRDVRLLVSLQQWLREVASTGRDRSILTDSLWVGEGGLIEYSRQRLWHHILKVQNYRKGIDLAAASLPSYISIAITRLRRLCGDTKVDSPVRQFSDIVEAAYSLRSAWKDLTAKTEVMKAFRDINMLGRPRAAYKCFKSVAFTFGQVTRLEMKPLIRRRDAQSNVTVPYSFMKNLCAVNNLPVSLLPEEDRYIAAPSLHVHAEMQILVSFAHNVDWHRRAHPYIGVSKKPCVLCDQILQHCELLVDDGAQGATSTFKARQSHGKVYPLWTLPRCEDLPSNSKRALAGSIQSAYQQMQQRLPKKLVLGPARAESSAGVTSAGSASATFAPLRDQHVKGGRPMAPPEGSNEGEQPSALGRKIKTVNVGRLPADGSDPELVPIAFHALSKTTDVKMFEFGKDYVPDFHEAWDPCQFDRRYRNIKLKGQACEDCNGEYRLYWNENPTLEDNETIKTFLKIEGEVEAMRRFWYGDVFFMKCSEHPTTFDFDVHDLPLTTLTECRVLLQRLFHEMWEDEYLEAQLEEDKYMEEDLAKSEADKEVLLQRMTPMQQAMLKLMPSGMLDLRAITDCDDGARRDMKMEVDPEDPTMVRVSSMVRQTALKTMGWTGFDSSQL